MAERHRSKDGSKDSEKILGKDGAVSGKGRDGGRLARDIGSRDELKRVDERPAGKTRITKQDKAEGDQ